MSYGLGQYKRTSVETASREQILLMLYQAAIKNCKKAIEAIEQRNIPKKGEYIGKLQDIIVELSIASTSTSAATSLRSSSLCMTT